MKHIPNSLVVSEKAHIPIQLVDIGTSVARRANSTFTTFVIAKRKCGAAFIFLSMEFQLFFFLKRTKHIVLVLCHQTKGQLYFLINF